MLADEEFIFEIKNLYQRQCTPVIDKNDEYVFQRIMKFEAMVYVRIILLHLSPFAYNLVALQYPLTCISTKKSKKNCQIQI